MDRWTDGHEGGERERRNKSESVDPYITIDTLYKSLSICCNITIVTILQGSSQYNRGYNL